MNQRGDWLLKAALVSFVIGLVALVVLFGWPMVTDGTAPLSVYLLTMCAPLGFLLGLIYAIRTGTAARRQRENSAHLGAGPADAPTPDSPDSDSRRN